LIEILIYSQTLPVVRQLRFDYRFLNNKAIFYSTFNNISNFCAKVQKVSQKFTFFAEKYLRLLNMEDITFNKEDYKQTPLTKGDYEGCTFKNCDFSGTDLTGIIFSNCEFIICNLSLAKLANTVFRDVKFIECKLLGLRFDHCNGFGLSFHFENCNLSHSSFFKTKIKTTLFRDSQLHEIDFTQCDLTGSLFDNCDLTRTVFANTIIEKADFRTAYNYSIDPEMNRIKKAMFSLQGVSGLLDKYNILIE
jgi:uncharacterized protein YjbI with pentapeptide repeats